MSNKAWAGVIGWPIAHSRSPLIHGYWLRQYGIAGRYERLAVRPEALGAFFERIAEERRAGLVGFNVTIPHKEAVCGLVDTMTPEAQAIGAVNTVWFEGARVVGDNTDAYGFMANLAQAVPGWSAEGVRAAVLGAGGAARAVVHGLLAAGVGGVRLFNRTRARAEALAEAFGPRVEVADWQELAVGLANDGLGDVGLLVNATSLGMEGAAPLELDLSGLPEGAVVADLVYTPLETALLAAARARGLRAVDGLGMLLHQAVPGFERWFGVRPEVRPALREHVIADLMRSQEGKGA